MKIEIFIFKKKLENLGLSSALHTSVGRVKLNIISYEYEGVFDNHFSFTYIQHCKI